MKHEKESARRLDLKLTPGSGNKWHSKSDAVGDTFRCEMKSTEKKSLSLKLEWLEKIVEEAIETGKVPMVSIRFHEASFASKDWVLLEQDTFLEMKEAWEKKEAP